MVSCSFNRSLQVEGDSAFAWDAQLAQPPVQRSRGIQKAEEFIYDDFICTGRSVENPKVKSILSLRNLFFVLHMAEHFLVGAVQLHPQLFPKRCPAACCSDFLSHFFCSLQFLIGFVLLAVLPDSSTMADVLIQADKKWHFLDVAFLFQLLFPKSAVVDKQEKHKGDVQHLKAFCC